MKPSYRIILGPIRDGAKAAHVYNDGLTVFMYDGANEARIRDADPKAIWYIDADTPHDPTTAALVGSGDLVIYGMHGDGEIGLEVVVGEDLTEAERLTGRWYEPQRGRINLPTGRLCIHSFNSLPMGDNGDAPDSDGAVVEVPPASYSVTLHRKDWDTMEFEGVADLEEAAEAGVDIWEARINDIVVLTRLEDPEGGVPGAILFSECIIP
ncbi:MAG: hypothetical protein HKN73_11985 [Gemmatimonadetes bacterium]|nr:hypothetical protein [Gemmatimonadota bacterium]